MKDKNGIELQIGDFVKTRSTGRRAFYIGKVIRIGQLLADIEYIGTDADGNKTGRWFENNLTKINEEEAVFLILQDNKLDNR